MFVAVIHLAAEKPDKSVERIFLDLRLKSPNGLHNGAPRSSRAHPAHEEFKQLVLGRREVNFVLAAKNLTGLGIKHQIRNLKLSRGAIRDRTPAQSPEPRQKFRK